MDETRDEYCSFLTMPTPPWSPRLLSEPALYSSELQGGPVLLFRFVVPGRMLWWRVQIRNEFQTESLSDRLEAERIRCPSYLSGAKERRYRRVGLGGIQ